MRRSSSSAARPLVSVITATIPERKPLLVECEVSVQSQTFGGWEHLILEDVDREGCSVMVNRLVAEASGEWLFPLADDDLMLPRCLELLTAHAEEGDIIYSPPLVWGRPTEWFTQAPPAIPATALIKRDLWLELGGYDESAVREEDRKMWIKAVNAGCRFVRVDTDPTWVYRHHAGNKSFNEGRAS